MRRLLSLSLILALIPLLFSCEKQEQYKSGETRIFSVEGKGLPNDTIKLVTSIDEFGEKRAMWEYVADEFADGKKKTVLGRGISFSAARYRLPVPTFTVEEKVLYPGMEHFRRWKAGDSKSDTYTPRTDGELLTETDYEIKYIADTVIKLLGASENVRRYEMDFKQGGSAHRVVYHFSDNLGFVEIDMISSDANRHRSPDTTKLRLLSLEQATGEFDAREYD